MKRSIVAAVLFLAMSLAAAAQENSGQEEGAARALRVAIAQMKDAVNAPPRTRIAALTAAISAYEEGLGTVRSTLRSLSLREAALAARLEDERRRIAGLIASLSYLGGQSPPLLFLHPDGPLASVRSAMILSDTTIVLKNAASALQEDAQNLAIIRAIQRDTQRELKDGLEAVQNARNSLNLALLEQGRPMPRPFAATASTQAQLDSEAETLENLIAQLPYTTSDDESFESRKGRLPLPALGTLLLRPDEADARGVRRPGVSLATRAQALVTSPTPATVRYRGTLAHYGNVIVLEPSAGYFLILSGMTTVYPEVGQDLNAHAPLGLMGGGPIQGDFAKNNANMGGVKATETLYIEIRKGAHPENPISWFSALKQQELK